MLLGKEIEVQALLLPLEERARLVDKLLSSLESPVDAQWFDEFDREMKSRLEGARRGEIESQAGDQVFERMWNLLRR